MAPEGKYNKVFRTPSIARGQLRIGSERLGDRSSGVANAVGIRDHVMPAHLCRSRSRRRQRRHHANQRGLSAPFGPSRPKISPACTVKLTSFTATKSPNCFFNLVTSIGLLLAAFIAFDRRISYRKS